MIKKIFIPKSIIPLLIFSLALTILRVIIFGKHSLVFISWNLLLSFIPFFVSSILILLKYKNKLKDWLIIILGVIWLLFLPNAPYLVTDLMHIGVVRAVPALYDSIFLFSSASVGIMFGLYSVSQMKEILNFRFSRKITSIILFIVMLLTSFGMYLGRFLRFNSWDVFVNPSYIVDGVKEIFSNNNDIIEAITYTLLFSLFIFIIYLSWTHKNNE